jgi:Glycosyl transferase family 8.
LPDLASWVDLNSGFMVIEPSAERMNDIISHLTVVPEGEHAINMGQHSDQSFLIGYCKGWSSNASVHLDHRYNIFHIHLDRYVNDLGYEYRGHVGADMQLALEPRIVAIVHFIGQVKPWFRNSWIEYYGSWFIPHRHKYYRASVRLWRHFYKLAMQAL